MAKERKCLLPRVALLVGLEERHADLDYRLLTHICICQGERVLQLFVLADNVCVHVTRVGRGFKGAAGKLSLELLHYLT